VGLKNSGHTISTLLYMFHTPLLLLLLGFYGTVQVNIKGSDIRSEGLKRDHCGVWLKLQHCEFNNLWLKAPYASGVHHYEFHGKIIHNRKPVLPTG